MLMKLLNYTPDCVLLLSVVLLTTSKKAMNTERAKQYFQDT